MIDNEKTNVLYGGGYDKETRFISPTIVEMSNDNSPISKEEIFGPILPVAVYSSDDELRSLLDKVDSPLSLYIFSNNKSFINQIKLKTSSGAICVNDIAAQFVNHHLPFGGVMKSGVGRYHGYSGFKEFSNSRSITTQSKINFLNLLSPPYTRSVKKLVDMLIGIYKKL